MTNKEMLRQLFIENELDKEDVYKHKNYTIITRAGIDKIQARQGITIVYEVIKCEPEYAVVKAIGANNKRSIQTFGSAKKGGKESVGGKWVSHGNTETWYVIEMAEKRAMSRAVLKLAGFYELGAFGEDEELIDDGLDR